MTENENQALSALEQLLDLIDGADWEMVHITVRGDVADGKYGSEFEAAYKAMVDKKTVRSGKHNVEVS